MNTQGYSDALDREYEREMQEIKKAADAWRKRWPVHCRSCHGYGGTVYYESHGFAGGGSEQIWESCYDCLEHEEQPHCPRCAYPITDEDPTDGVPCEACGWTYQDGEPM